jgi:hypothetical protein
MDSTVTVDQSAPIDGSKAVLAMADTPAHTQKATYTVEEWFPAHAPRTDDPHYSLFNKTRARLVRLGALHCWRCGVKEGDALLDDSGKPTDAKASIELHHSIVEFSLANAVDVEEFAKLYPELHVADDATFLQFVESEGNLMPLCVKCHRGRQGIHCVQYPGWLIERFKKKGVPPIVQVVKGQKAAGD